MALSILLTALTTQHSQAATEDEQAKAKNQTGLLSSIETLGFDTLNILKGRLNTKEKNLYRNTPFIEINDMSLQAEYQKNLSFCTDKKTAGDPERKTKCKTYEYYIPYLRDPSNPTKAGDEISKEISGEILRNWKVFQERTFFHITNRINSSLVSFAPPFYQATITCHTPLENLVDLRRKINDALGQPDFDNLPNPDVKISTSKEGMAKAFNEPNLKIQDVDNDLYANFNAMPRVETNFYCDNIPIALYPDTALKVYLPNFQECTHIGCVYGANFPRPLLYNPDEIRQRAQDACNHTISQYYLQDYLKNTTQTILTKMPLGLMYNSFGKYIPGSPDITDLDGVFLAPIDSKTSSLQSMVDVMNQADDKRIVLYARQLIDKTRLRIPTDRMDTNRPGSVNLEDMKRWFMPGTIGEQEAAGYATFFQVTSELQPRIYPNIVNYYAHYNYCWYLACTPVPVPMPVGAINLTPAGCQVLGGEGPGTLTMQLPTYTWRYVTVPEGHPIPHIRKDPYNLLNALTAP